MRTSAVNDRSWQDPLDHLEKTGTLPVELFLTFRVNQLSTAFERQWTRFMKEAAGVNLSEWRILAWLDEDPSTFARLVEATGVNKALLHRSAQALAALGLVKIGDTPGDARSTTLSLTQKGHKLLDKVRPLALARQKHFLDVLTPRERQMIYAVLEKLRGAATQWDSSQEPICLNSVPAFRAPSNSR